MKRAPFHSHWVAFRACFPDDLDPAWDDALKQAFYSGAVAGLTMVFAGQRRVLRRELEDHIDAFHRDHPHTH